MKTKRIVITGGPGSGKTALIEHLVAQGFDCLPEISREVIKQAQQDGIEQLFLEKPLLFSELLLAGRLEQFHNAQQSNSSHLFYDRGLPDVPAYMDYLGTMYSEVFTKTCEEHRYDAVLVLPPWEDIYIQDNERYESFDQAVQIFHFLKRGYEQYGYEVVLVPPGTLDQRKEFILQQLDDLF